ncbi:MAG: hypothetical protein HKO65_19975 [Gemmatimonadetes bacterium]|nr:hypothetical protein [Gemmatimonadota bacterium]NNM07383.1 hypothetical protein [Gemmatimonadota bacterium]
MRARPLRVAFFVQGEGRGHMTQALALKRILEDGGHEVVAAFMGENPLRTIPEFFRTAFAAPIHTYLAPVFVVDPVDKGVRPWDSLFQALRRFPRYWRQGPDLDRTFRSYQPDLVVNFYDLIGGLYSAVFRPQVPMVAVGHQFLFHHSEFETPKERAFQVNMIRVNNLLTSLDARLRLALSFSPLSPVPYRRVRVVPPLLRREVLEAEPVDGRHLLAYVLNPGYSDELVAWHKEQSDLELHCFWDKTDAPPEYSPREGLTFHRLSSDTFLKLLASCRGYTSTAGFESVCEAAYLGKPISLVPTKKHVEQLCNALDAERAGLAVWREDFHLSDFLSKLESWDYEALEEYRRWVRSAPGTFLQLLEAVALGKDAMQMKLASRAGGRVRIP